MKLFVWVNPYRVSYGVSQVYAVAETVEQAREQAQRGLTLEYGRECKNSYYGDPRSNPLGEPTFVLDAPCAVWDRWSE